MATVSVKGRPPALDGHYQNKLSTVLILIHAVLVNLTTYKHICCHRPTWYTISRSRIRSGQLL